MHISNSTTHGDATHKFNGDIGYAPGSADRIKARFAQSPAMIDALLDEDLLSEFGKYETAAVGKKRQLRKWGMVSLCAAGIGLAFVALELFLAAFNASETWVHVVNGIGTLIALCAIAVALMTVKHYRKTWLDNRFAAERLRQWHFQTLLDARLMRLAAEDSDRFKTQRAQRFAEFIGGELHQLTGARWRLINTPGDGETFLHSPETMSADHPLAAELWEAFKWLRLEHQTRHWEEKLNPDESLATWEGRVRDLGQTCLQLATFLLVFQLLFLIIRVIRASLSAPDHETSIPGTAGSDLLNTATLAVTGLQMLLLAASVTFKAINEGMGYSREMEHYRNMAIVYVGIQARAKHATTSKDRFSVMRDVELWAQSELKDFLVVHANAQFLI